VSDSNGGAIGIALLGSISAFSIWSSVNPSFFTLKAFTKPDHEGNIRFGMKVGLGLTIVLAAALYLGYGKKGQWPAIFTAITGGGLYFSYDHMLKKSLRENAES
jgi:hypothetical protein